MASTAVVAGGGGTVAFGIEKGITVDSHSSQILIEFQYVKGKYLCHAQDTNQ